jgi:hypothetical protein
MAVSSVWTEALMATSSPAALRANAEVEKKNYIINGAMMVSQENGGAALTANAAYPADQWSIFSVHSGVLTFQQVASATPGGSPNRIRLAVTAADTAMTASKVVAILQRIEGLRVADLKLGTPSAKKIVVQFGCRGPAGTYCASITNGAFNRSMPIEFTISAAEAYTDVVRSIVFSGDQAGAWLKDNGIGLYLYVTLMAGSTYQGPSGVWAAGNFFATVNQSNFMGTVNNVFELFDVGLYEGDKAPAFIVPDYSRALAECQRYWEPVGMTVTSQSPPYHNTSWFRVTKRASPTLTIVSGNAQGAMISAVAASALDGFRQIVAAATASDIGVTANARL